MRLAVPRWGALVWAVNWARSGCCRPMCVRTAGIGSRGGERNRTAVQGFAVPCLNHSATPPGLTPSPQDNAPLRGPWNRRRLR